MRNRSTRRSFRFNPRTHEECDIAQRAYSGHHQVSIHALTKSATRRSVSLRRCDLFQSTHSRRVRQKAFFLSAKEFCFNPRTHEECDLFLGFNWEFPSFQSTHSRRVRHRVLEKVNKNGKVSIHALTKSATTSFIFLSSIPESFNPRTHEECDWCPTLIGSASERFQSTHSRRVRQNKASNC